MVKEANNQLAASLAEMEYLISGLVGGDTTEWRFAHSAAAPDVVIGATELIARYDDKYPQRLRVAQWLGPNAFDGEAGYDVCHFSGTYLFMWAAGTRNLDEVRCWDITAGCLVEPQAANLLGLLELLRIAEPAEPPSPEPVLSAQTLLDRLALTQAYLDRFDDDPA